MHRARLPRRRVRKRLSHGGGPVRDPACRPGSGFAQCPAPAGITAVRAGRLFDSQSGRMLTNQVVLITGERITGRRP
jgi:hypothetical protein